MKAFNSTLNRGTSQLKRSGFKNKSNGFKVRSAPLRRTAFNTKPKKLTKSDQVKLALEALPYYAAIPRKYRYKGKNQEIKDKAWTVVSDYVRCRDFLRYGKCVSSGVSISHWRDVDAGHFYNMASYGAELGFNTLNIHAQSKHDNHLASMHTGAAFEKELIRRYGVRFIDDLASLKNVNVKADDFWFIRKIAHTYGLFLELKKEYPAHDYPKYLTE